MAYTVNTKFSYFDFQARHNIEKPYEILINLPKDDVRVPRSNFAFKDVDCEVQDVGGREEDFSLDRNGFAWKKYKTKCGNLKDRKVIEMEYFPELENFIRENVEGRIKKIHFFEWRVCALSRVLGQYAYQFFQLRVSMDQAEFFKKTVNLEDGLDPLLPSLHPHIGKPSFTWIVL